MQFKSIAVFAAGLSAAYAQTVSFNASQIVTDLENLTNLAELTKGIAGSITLGNAVTQVPALATSLTTLATTLVADAANDAILAAGGVFDVTDQAAICLSLSDFIAASQDMVDTIAGETDIISAPPFNSILAAALAPVQAGVNAVVSAIAPSIPNCVSTSQVDLGTLDDTIDNLLNLL